MNRDSSLDFAVKKSTEPENQIRKRSVLFMRENRPIFQKLAPVVCKEDNQQEICNNDVRVVRKGEYDMGGPCNRDVNKITSNLNTDEENNPSEPQNQQKWSSAMI